jgi:hypothetical protein
MRPHRYPIRLLWQGAVAGVVEAGRSDEWSLAMVYPDLLSSIASIFSLSDAHDTDPARRRFGRRHEGWHE